VNNVYDKKETSFKKKNKQQQLAVEEPILRGRLEEL
jgi:hypothetical protein